ncbi:hypothetical protein JR316_0013345 [Psilocybe cubensis]|uniref:Uncharacterized protein n=2 Tax=Psilocybe cubensis TaxID=181762 RepID=A0ACB8GHN2_PSICU|nr:hypothetical protein JR316_0013345 [Psilocybe cubensis]KAH9474877.1 hypothetical protein JR316_0013345 [Psilocybe cubensis]
MPVGEYSLRLQSGITGGFAPPTPNAIFTVTQPQNSDTLNITAAIRPAGTPSLQEIAPKQINSKQQHIVDLVEELYGILKTLPTESPPGSEDIYGLDTSIAFGSADLEWCNGGPQGCGGGTSSVQATDEEKAKFKRAVDIVHELVKEE